MGIGNEDISETHQMIVSSVINLKPPGLPDIVIRKAYTNTKSLCAGHALYKQEMSV